MPIEPKDALEVFGVTDLAKYETVDDFKAAIEKDWLKASTAHNDPGVKSKVVGTFHRNGNKQIQDINTMFDLGLEVDEKGNLLDYLPKMAEALKPKFDGIKELQEKVKNSAPADAITKFEHDLKEAQKKADANAKSAKEWETKFTTLDTDTKTKARTSQVDGEWNGAMSSVTFSPQVDALRKEGFTAMMRKEYQVLIDDEGKAYAANAKGEPLMHPKKAAERWTLAEALKAKAEELKLIGQNPQGGRPVNTPVIRQREEPANATPAYGRRERRAPDRIM